MPHQHKHEHSHAHTPTNKKILSISLVIISSYMIIEFLGGYYFNSLALMADAGHMANDSLSLLLALIALFLNAQNQKRFALLNGTSLIVVAVWILVEATERWQYPTTMLALPMLGVAITGLLVNIFVAWLMMKGDHENLNIKAAYLHVLADLFGSLVAIIAGLSAWLLNWQWVDLVASGILSLLVLRSGINIVRQAIIRASRCTLQN
ncbi:cation diffusion facilitator family transporter [uncultured Aggregatibacter sp.]|uniref:cation diffusion facilitator family transporter n=1 Tax=uncultured Aggregatibacter sp. TaxID=470564 RepID=UPI001A44382B|nr:cation diffusion facilitator family transporter [uncultured Aggregatibacter sp.]VTX73352.1 Cadmium, cobalt and zinc/H(+)-K(+) antiporter [uncultured Aggregatibacter sp.]